MINRIKYDRFMDFNELVKKTAGLIEQGKNKVKPCVFKPTYFKDLDQAIDGLEFGKVTAIVGRPSMGKTLFAMNIVRNVVNQGSPVLVFSLSLEKEDWTRCFLCASAEVELHKARRGILNDEESARLKLAAERCSSLSLFVVDDTRHIKGIKQSIDESIKEHNIELVLIDGMSDIYNNSLRSMKDRGKRYDQQLKVLKEIAAQWNIPILVTQGLSRRFERNPHIFVPKYEFGPKEGNLYKNVDRILHIYREEYYRLTKTNIGRMDIRIPSMKFGDSNCGVSLIFDKSIGLVKEYGEGNE